MTHGSLFSGIGGFDLAASWMGWENVFHCEINPFGRKILNYYWPNAISYTDITKTDFSTHAGKIDILSGGFPCQPYSLAGKRKGKEDDRHLWPAMLTAIRAIRPHWIVGENVHGIINWSKGLVFDEIQTSLETEGYEVFSYVLPACGVNAPHRRDRTWFIAYSHSNGRQWRNGKNEIEPDKRRLNAQYDSFENIESNANTDGKRLKRIYHKNGPEMGEVEKPIKAFFTHIKQFRSDDNIPEPFVIGRNDGLPIRLDDITFSDWREESTKSFGNAVVPYVVYQIFKTIEEYSNLNK